MYYALEVLGLTLNYERVFNFYVELNKMLTFYAMSAGIVCILQTFVLQSSLACICFLKLEAHNS